MDAAELYKRVIARWPQYEWESLWPRLRDYGYVEDALRDEKPMVALKRSANDMALSTFRAPSGRPKRIEVPPAKHTGPDLAYAEAVSCYYAKLAEEQELESRWSFRRRCIGGVVLTDPQARAFTESPAPRYMTLEQFQQWGIPVVGQQEDPFREHNSGVNWGRKRIHRVVTGIPAQPLTLSPPGRKDKQPRDYTSQALTFVQPDVGSFILRATSCVYFDGFRVQPGSNAPAFPVTTGYENYRDAIASTIIETRGVRPKSPPPEWVADGLIHADWNEEDWQRLLGQMEDEDALLPIRRKETRLLEETLLYPDEDGAELEVRGVWPCSVLDDLRKCAQGLARRFHWREADCTWFILTGKRPFSHPLYASTTQYTMRCDVHTEIHVCPWVSAKTTRAYYGNIQSRSGNDGRHPDKKTLGVFQFVTEEFGTKPGKDADWNKLLESYREKYSGDKVITCPARLKQYYERGKKAVCGHVPLPPPEEEAAQEEESQTAQ